MKTLIVGIGALGGLIAARLRAAGLPVWLATRDAEQADKLRASGLRVTGMGGAATVQTTTIAPLEAYGADDKFELVLLATKAHDAIEAAPRLSLLLGPNATLLPIQNGGVPEMLGERLGSLRTWRPFEPGCHDGGARRIRAAQCGPSADRRAGRRRQRTNRASPSMA
jgi:2-dehydropantoate 2-reductase